MEGQPHASIPTSRLPKTTRRQRQELPNKAIFDSHPEQKKTT
jgi:hypothetical protein